MSFTDEFFIDPNGGRHTSPRPFRLSDEDEDEYGEDEGFPAMFDEYDA